ncbi:hypothetical protein ACFFTK_21215 [Pseudonocardia petroleophila]|uniref:Uncharacterized protein n=1 Tax=Pseudonocardia petroleophila TaxID=37331 RepID=A0A7G7MF85_9PSEU|nr:hypothetical protein [Pseudonocardia petroleophila]QNG51446.1 hypothetical protein H6H00_25470 [Pseudonocardia petroleophila]
MTARDGMIAAAPRQDMIDRAQNDAEIRRGAEPAPAGMLAAIPVAVPVWGAGGPTAGRGAIVIDRPVPATPGPR